MKPNKPTEIEYDRRAPLGLRFRLAATPEEKAATPSASGGLSVYSVAPAGVWLGRARNGERIQER